MREITQDDPFGQALSQYSKGLLLGVEIGGGTGDGSTQCIKTRELFSFEVHPDRIGRHDQNLRSRQGGLAIRDISSNPMKWMSEDEVIDFYNNTNTNLNAHPIETILGWHKEEFFIASKYPYGRMTLKDKIDFLLLDGGVFSGRADLEEWLPRVREGGFIALDDINDIKNYHNYHWLKDSNFDCVWENKSYRNGSAIFKK
jgi:hypothetical protein